METSDPIEEEPKAEKGKPPVPVPSEHDIAMAKLRQEIAERQERAFVECLEHALKLFGAGWVSSGKHCLFDKDDEERCRYTEEKPTLVKTVFTVKRRREKRHFTINEQGQAVECASYEAGFGDLLYESHPSKGFEHQGKWHFYHRYSLCFGSFELYEPKTAEQLAALRESRVQKKAERKEKKYQEEFPLFALMENPPKE